VSPSPWSWNAAWEELAIVGVAAGAYVLAARKWSPSRLRALAFAGGLVLLVLVFVSPVHVLSLHYLLSAHLVQNVALAEWAPALVVAGLPPGLASALSRFGPVRALTHPLVALPLWLAAYVLWHVPALYDAALDHHALLQLEHATYFVTGALLWWPVFHEEPRRLASGTKAAYLFAAFVLASPLGLLLALAPTPLYQFYVDAPRLWGLSAITDQQIAGVLMAVSEAVVFFALFAVYFVRFLAEEEAGFSPSA
jgi:cytochrome c oxidase assembly factor CtaG